MASVLCFRSALTIARIVAVQPGVQCVKGFVAPRRQTQGSKLGRVDYFLR